MCALGFLLFAVEVYIIDYVSACVGVTAIACIECDLYNTRCVKCSGSCLPFWSDKFLERYLKCFFAGEVDCYFFFKIVVVFILELKRKAVTAVVAGKVYADTLVLCNVTL